MLGRMLGTPDVGADGLGLTTPLAGPALLRIATCEQPHASAPTTVGVVRPILARTTQVLFLYPSIDLSTRCFAVSITP